MSINAELLYFEGCPNSDPALQRLRAALDHEGAAAPVKLTEIRGAEEAVAHRFLGSPTIRINSEDVEPEARSRTDYGFTCRVYRDVDGSSVGVPPESTIAQSIHATRLALLREENED